MKAVKQERHDEAEIQELAAKMLEANRAKMSVPTRAPMPPGQSMNILSFLTSNKKPRLDQSAMTVAQNEAKNVIDEESARGRFGWTTIGKVHIPYITRGGDQYCAVRMVEMKVLNKYLNFLHQDIYNCTCIRSYYITEAEGRLLNEINFKHCDYQYGRDQFTARDLIVRLSDAQEFYNFLDSCYTKLMSGNLNPLDRCGFIRINKESVVPYTIYNNLKYVPLFYFEGETDNLKLKADKLEGWDLSYLKFCCKVQGIRNELFAHDSCSVISLNDIKNYFPPGTLFEDYWPKKTLDSQLLINGKVSNQIGQWTRQPAAPPVMHAHPPPPSPKPATQAKAAAAAAANNQLQNVQAMYSSYGLGGGQPAYHPTQPRTASSATRNTYPPSSNNRQIRPPYCLTPAPPPLVPGSQGPATYSNNNVQTTVSTNYMLLTEPTLSQSGYRQANPSLHKYPPPLIPVRHITNGLRYDTPPQNYYPAADVVDLSSPTSQASVRQPIINQQPAHQQPPSRTPQTSATDDSGSITNGRMPNINNVHTKLMQLPDTPTGGSHIPYQMHKARVEGKLISCINMKPYVHTDLLVTLPDIISSFFNNVSMHSCQQVLNVLGIDVYQGNSSQMRVLMENGKCQSMNEILPLVPVRSVIDFMPQLKYMVSSLLADMATKRQRSS